MSSAQGIPPSGNNNNHILAQKQDAVRALTESGGDGGGILSQLSENPFFTAVGASSIPLQKKK